MAETDGNTNTAETSGLQLWLKINGGLYLGLGLVAYGVKFGLTWHDAGAPLTISDLKFHPYYNMIIILYFCMGPYLLMASPDPAKHKALLSYNIWGMGFAHGIIATLAVFSHFEPLGYYGPSVFGDIPKTVGGINNWDKLLLACPTWFLLGTTNLVFVKKNLGSYLFPWEVVQAPTETAALTGQQIWLKINGALYLGLGLLAYGVKFGLTWHDAGKPLTISDLKFHPYYNMIIILYFIMGPYLLQASADPAQCKSLISYVIWAMGFAHGFIATLAVFSHFEPLGYYGPSIFGDIPKTVGGINNWDKLILACPTWFLLGFTSLYFAKKNLGSYLFPWEPVEKYEQLP